MRKFIVTLLVGAIVCLGVTPILAAGGEGQLYTTLQDYQSKTGKRITKFNEAPELAKMVKEGKLPPVAERLPEEPVVLDPADKIGKYGGTLQQSYVETGVRVVGIDDITYEYPVVYSNDMQRLDPNLFKSWDITNGGRIFTFHLRKGLKWSDGAPFTVDDFMFWYEDMATYTDLYPNFHSYVKLGGEVGKWEKLDDHTLRITWPKPHGLFLLRFARWRPVPYSPKHYLMKFHPKYTPMAEIEKMMKDEGYDTWRDFFNFMGKDWANPGVPTMNAWMQLGKMTDPVIRMVRNPYYWKIDTAGNQLPYIDEIRRVVAGDQEAVLLKALAGEIDIIMGEYLGFFENIATLKANEGKGKYKVSPSSGNNQFGALYFNLSHQDPVLKKAFNDKRFRIALSMAMNREEINDIIFRGLLRPSQPAPPEGAPLYGERHHFQSYIEFDPDFANYLLDEVGFDKKNSAGIRLRPDGKPLQITIMPHPWQASLPRIGEMLKKYWEDVGVGVNVKPIGGGIWFDRFRSGQYDIGLMTNTMTGLPPIFHPDRDNTRPISALFRANWAWGLWYETGGKEGEEPPTAVKRLEEIAIKYLQTVDRHTQIQMEKEVHQIHIDNLWILSALTVPGERYVHVITDRLKNVPRPLALEMNPGQPSTWYIE